MERSSAARRTIRTVLAALSAALLLAGCNVLDLMVIESRRELARSIPPVTPLAPGNYLEGTSGEVVGFSLAKGIYTAEQSNFRLFPLTGRVQYFIVENYPETKKKAFFFAKIDGNILFFFEMDYGKDRKGHFIVPAAFGKSVVATESGYRVVRGSQTYRFLRDLSRHGKNLRIMTTYRRDD